MFWRNRNGFLIIISLTLLIVSSAAARPRKMQRLSTGTWGGSHIRIEVGPRSAAIDYDCANGTIARGALAGAALIAGSTADQ